MRAAQRKQFPYRHAETTAKLFGLQGTTDIRYQQLELDIIAFCATQLPETGSGINQYSSRSHRHKDWVWDALESEWRTKYATELDNLRDNLVRQGYSKDISVKGFVCGLFGHFNSKKRVRLSRTRVHQRRQLDSFCLSGFVPNSTDTRPPYDSREKRKRTETPPPDEQPAPLTENNGHEPSDPYVEQSLVRQSKVRKESPTILQIPSDWSLFEVVVVSGDAAVEGSIRAPFLFFCDPDEPVHLRYFVSELFQVFLSRSRFTVYTPITKHLAKLAGSDDSPRRMAETELQTQLLTWCRNEGNRSSDKITFELYKGTTSPALPAGSLPVTVKDEDRDQEMSDCIDLTTVSE